MKECRQTICLEVVTPCQPAPRKQSRIQQTTEHSASIHIEELLQEQSAKYISEIDSLNRKVFELTHTIQRLEIRNKRDQESEKTLRVEYNLLLARLNERVETATKIETKVVERVKEVPLEVDNPALLAEIEILKNKIKELLIDLNEAKSESRQLIIENTSLKAEIDIFKKAGSKLQGQLETIRREGEEKERSIQRLTQLNTFLKENKEVIKETKHLFPDWRAKTVNTETKIDTVYVEKPVEKTVFVEVPTTIRHFVQPERSVVNRVVTCAPAGDCSCEEMDRVIPAFQQEINRMDEEVTSLHKNVDLYAQERRKLVGIIGERDTELRSLQSRIRMMQTDVPVRAAGESRVTVEVRKAQNSSNLCEEFVEGARFLA